MTVAEFMAAMAGDRDAAAAVARARDDMRGRGREWLDAVLAASRLSRGAGGRAGEAGSRGGSGGAGRALGQRLEQFGELGALGGVRGPEDGADPALHRPQTRSITPRPFAARCTSTRRRSTGSVRRDARPESTSLSTTRVAVGAGRAVCEAISPMLRPPPRASISSTRQPSRLTPSAAVTGASAAATARSTRSSSSTRPVTRGASGRRPIPTPFD